MIHSERHFNFILESLSDINEELIKRVLVYTAEGDILNILEFISQNLSLMEYTRIKRQD